LPDEPLDVSETFCHVDVLGADIRAPPHGSAAPDPVVIVDFGQSAAGCRIPGVCNVSEGAQQRSRTEIVFVDPVDGTSRRARSAQDAA